MFTPDEIEARLRVRPFIPLRVVMSSGQMVDINHPDLVVVGRRSVFIGVASTENPAHFDMASQVSLMHITDLQNLPRHASVETNGAG